MALLYAARLRADTGPTDNDTATLTKRITSFNKHKPTKRQKCQGFHVVAFRHSGKKRDAGYGLASNLVPTGRCGRCQKTSPL